MSSQSSEEENVKTNSYLNQYLQNSRLENEIQPKSCELSSSSGSTSSLLSPIYRESYESEDEENESLNKQTDRLSRRRSESTPRRRAEGFSTTPVVSTPSGQKKSRQNICLKRETLHKKCNLEPSKDSTTSLLSPIYHDSYESEEGETEASKTPTSSISDREMASTTNKTVSKKLTIFTPVKSKTSRTSARKTKLSEEEERHLKEVELTAWEEWLIKKAKEERIEMQKKSQREMILKQAKLKEQEELQRKKVRAEEEHRRWVQRKNEKEKLEKEKKFHKEQEEKYAREQERERTAERGSKVFQEWLKKKKLQKIEIKKVEKNAEEKKIAETQERREKADKVFQEWLEKVRTRPRTVPSSFGYANGKLTGYYDGSSYPAPSYWNPIPWKPIPVPCTEDNIKKITCKEKVKPKSTSLYIPHSNVPFRPKDNLVVGSGWRKAR
ncbi:coiled-coil domain-containing protein 34-like [Pristis pectinata]|uniref:coiled-coil domain-containing protein 34-like n=1 Tax=Pristis pectinata TaxID=685728 RepID=UPI00223C9998|nr:coiled-coil domain-containing protein 34-like [Pristis pectinata]